LNNRDHGPDERGEGLVAPHPPYVRKLESSKRSVASANSGRKGKVGVVNGGGSGHKPALIGYVGKGMADGVAVGNICACPPRAPILEVTKAVDGGKGVIYLYGNYAGDCMNFDMAQELASLEGIRVETVLVTDDVASAPKGEMEK